MPVESIRERIGALDAKLTAAHTRLDKVETSTAADLIEIKKDVKLLLGWMNRSLGWAAALVFVGSIAGGLVSKLIK